jgi:uncharacterized protein YkwD
MDFNFVDLIVLVFLIYFIWQGYQTGFLGGLFNILSTIISFAAAVVFYPALGGFLQSQLKLSENLALVVAFFSILILVEIIVSFAFHRIYAFLVPTYKKLGGFLVFDKVAGIIPSVLVGIFLVSVFLLLPLILPVKETIREPVSASWWGRNALPHLLTYQGQIEQLLNRLPYKNLAFLITPNPTSDEIVQLNFPEEISLKPDEASERALFNLVNKERKARSLKILVWRDDLRNVGRKHCLDMFERGYFSHYTPEGKSPFDRMDDAGIEYRAAGENLAYAPTVEVAHNGLMNSEGHRENILRVEFGHLGVGVIDGGINGKMFCQTFTD